MASQTRGPSARPPPRTCIVPEPLASSRALSPTPSSSRSFATLPIGRTPISCTAYRSVANRSITSLRLCKRKRRVRGISGPLWYYKQKGFYYAQVKRYFDTFGRDQVGVWLYEDLRNDTIGTLREVFRFLDVDECFVPDASMEYNPS